MSELKLTCPICKVAPKKAGSSYCAECDRKYAAQQYHKRKERKTPWAHGQNLPWNANAKERAAARKAREVGRVTVPVSQLLGSEK